MFPTPDLGMFRPQFLGTQYDWMFRTAELGTFPSLDLGTQPKPIRLRSQVLTSELSIIYNLATCTNSSTSTPCSHTHQLYLNYPQSVPQTYTSLPSSLLSSSLQSDIYRERNVEEFQYSDIILQQNLLSEKISEITISTFPSANVRRSD